MSHNVDTQCMHDKMAIGHVRKTCFCEFAGMVSGMSQYLPPELCLITWQRCITLPFWYKILLARCAQMHGTNMHNRLEPTLAHTGCKSSASLVP